MPFLVEDGTGVVGAVSYASVTAYRDWCASRGIDLTGVSDTTLQRHLANATAFLDQLAWNGASRWTDNLPRLGLPRYDLVVGCGSPYFEEGTLLRHDEVPWTVPQATIILANEERLSGEDLNKPRDPSRVVVEKSIGSAGISKKFATSTDQPEASVGRRYYPEAMALVRGLHRGQGVASPVIVI